MADNKTVRLISHNNSELSVPAGTNLLAALNENGIFLRSDCGGKGTCGKCRVEETAADSKVEILACVTNIDGDITVNIPQKTLASPFILTKAPLEFPEYFKQETLPAVKDDEVYDIAIDLGTTTIAIYLCHRNSREVVASTSLKNPQFPFGADVISRINAIIKQPALLVRLQQLVIKGIEWGINSLVDKIPQNDIKINTVLIVGNPTMIHIVSGIDPKSIGTAPYLPAFYESKQYSPADLSINISCEKILTMPQVSGFIGSDVLAAGLAVDLLNQPDGTLLIDLGTNGELLLKHKDGLLAASCATGPAFEGAEIECGVQAIPGAINEVQINDNQQVESLSMINPDKIAHLRPVGLCGPGIISAIAEMYDKKILTKTGAFSERRKHFNLTEPSGKEQSDAVFISAKDIRAIQLGKGALITGIEMLLKEAGLEYPSKILIAGAFGSHVKVEDMLRLGMITEAETIESVGNAAGAGAVMAVCDESIKQSLLAIAEKTRTIDLFRNATFQKAFLANLNFPPLPEEAEETSDQILDIANS